MIRAVLSCWPLLATTGLMLVGNGALVTLIGLRAPLEGFSTGTIGIVMAGYYVGMLGGAALVPRLIARIGPVRTLATAAILYTVGSTMHVLLIDPVSWTLLRVLVGAGSSALYIVVESWLNDRTTNATRGILLSVYSVVQLGGFAIGQAATGVVDLRAASPFLWTAIVMAIGALPLLLSNLPPPSAAAPRSADPRGLLRVAPLAAVGCVLVGLSQGAFYSMGVTWADAQGLGAAGAAIFMALASVGGIAFQFPVGALSDRMDRRIMIAIVSFGTAGLALLLGVVIGVSVVAAQAVAFVLGGLLGVAWPLLLSHAYDRFTPADRVSMGGALILIFGAGAILGGPIAAQAIERIGGPGLPLTLAVLGAALGAYALWRIARREPASAPEGFAPAAPGARPGHRRE